MTKVTNFINTSMTYLKKTATTLMGSLAATVGFAFLVSMACQPDDSNEEKAAGPVGTEPTAPVAVELQNAFPSLTFKQPVELTHANDGTNRLFLIEQEGKIRVFENNAATKTAETYLDIVTKVASGGEMGLLGLAFHPDFKQNGYFYVNYTKNNPRETVISRFKASPTSNRVDPGTETILLKFAQPYSNHNGGKVAFGPDGFLYIATGDGGSGGDPQNNGQNLKTYLGKILRIDVNKTDKGAYGIPADNPFVSNANAFPEIYAYGLRNPWRFSFDPETGQLWTGDVGQNRLEEIDIIKKGGNYGWRLKEAKDCFNPNNDCNQGQLIDPIHEYPRDEGISVTGGVVYRGNSTPALKGKYVYADFGSGKVWALSFEGDKKTGNQLLVNAGGSVSAFGEDARQEIYLLDYSSGTVKRFTAK
ncbi:PQQ-dependent sugar dehydrogenase [Larkinella insperata]|uniref:PQQ-dependent sugar dehydrogenase n=1 Tax=Larkinella insperata TaxID=332158 RepID=A0ABW3Q2A6_9BACT|nr:PQQ-dependent sugar dehydrogenase [Larkinella insperata]